MGVGRLLISAVAWTVAEGTGVGTIAVFAGAQAVMNNKPSKNILFIR
jgi:hypothetical protein